MGDKRKEKKQSTDSAKTFIMKCNGLGRNGQEWITTDSRTYLNGLVRVDPVYQRHDNVIK
jgi:hypothetical protein